MNKNFRTFFGLSLISLIGLVPLLFSGDVINENEIDVYLFIDYKMYPELIAYDIAEICSVIFFIVIIRMLIPTKKYKRYISAFLISSILSLFGYFLVYYQYSSMVQVPILILMIIFIYFKYDYEEGSNVR